MNQAELLRYVEEDWKDYRGKYLVPFYKEKAANAKDHYAACYTAPFLGRHSVEGTVTQQKALDVCRTRSHNGANNFESTVITPALLAAVVVEVADRFVASHDPAYHVYDLKCSGQLIHVSCKAGQGFLLRQARGSFKVGLDATGLICHLEATQYDDLRQN